MPYPLTPRSSRLVPGPTTRGTTMNTVTPGFNRSTGTPRPPGAARVGIGGPVGSGKTRLLEQLIPRFISRGTNLAVITNDLATKDDAERVRRSGLIDPARVLAGETGACPHTAIREDPTMNIQAAHELDAKYEKLDLILIESGGANLPSTFSLDLARYWTFLSEVAGGRPVQTTNCGSGEGVDQVVDAIAAQVLFDR